MSDNVLTEEGNYIQSPSDDIESFFWAFFWAVLQNNTTSHSDRERKYADMFKNGLRRRALHRYIDLEAGGVLHAIVSKWEQARSRMSGLYMYFSESLTALAKAGHFENMEEEARYWKLAWHVLALEGVYTSLKIPLEDFY